MEQKVKYYSRELSAEERVAQLPDKLFFSAREACRLLGFADNPGRKIVSAYKEGKYSRAAGKISRGALSRIIKLRTKRCRICGELFFDKSRNRKQEVCGYGLCRDIAREEKAREELNHRRECPICRAVKEKGQQICTKCRELEQDLHKLLVQRAKEVNY